METFPIMVEDKKSLPLTDIKDNQWEQLLKQLVDETKDQQWANIPKVEGKWPEKIWNMIEKAKHGSNTFDSTPIKEIYADPNPLDFDENSICGYIGCVKSQESKDKVLEELPQ